jgi:hypothetical protein
MNPEPSNLANRFGVRQFSDPIIFEVDAVQFESDIYFAKSIEL